VIRFLVANQRWRLWLITAAVMWLATRFHENGHGWGDDFALYVNQARGLVWGNTGDVTADMQFSVANSAYSTFSPIAYPWVFPVLLMPIVAVADIDWSLLKLVPTTGFTLTAVALLVIARRVTSRRNAALATLLIVVNPVLLGFTDMVLSDLVFSGIVMLSIYLLDRWVEHRPFASDARMAMALGVVIALAIHTRREGLALLPALAAAQFIRARRSTRQGVASGHDKGPKARSVWIWALGSAFTIQVLLPAPILNSTGTSALDLENITFNVKWYVNSFAQLFGFNDGGDAPIEFLNSVTAGQTVLILITLVTAIGIIDGLASFFWREPKTTAHHSIALIAVTMIVLIAPFREQRYLFTVLPLFLLNTIHGAKALGRLYRLDRTFDWGLTIALTCSLIGNLPPTVASLDYHREYEYTHWGPADPSVIELFDAVERITDQRDVVVFFQARSMNLNTGRLSIQGNSESMMVERGDWYAMERNSEYIQTPLTPERAEELRFVSVWENDRFILWKIPSDRHTGSGIG
jgi:hypothetical protein